MFWRTASVEYLHQMRNLIGMAKLSRLKEQVSLFQIQIQLYFDMSVMYNHVCWCFILNYIYYHHFIIAFLYGIIIVINIGGKYLMNR